MHSFHCFNKKNPDLIQSRIYKDAINTLQLETLHGYLNFILYIRLDY